MSLKTILSNVGHAFEKIFVVGEKVAVAAEPTIDILFPGVSAIFNAAVTAAGTIEAASIAANAQTGTGATKAAVVAANVAPSIIALAEQNGMATPTADEIAIIVKGAVSIVNALKPAPPSGLNTQSEQPLQPPALDTTTGTTPIPTLPTPNISVIS